MRLNDEVLFLSQYLTEKQLTDFLLLKISAGKKAMKEKKRTPQNWAYQPEHYTIGKRKSEKARRSSYIKNKG